MKKILILFTFIISLGYGLAQPYTMCVNDTVTDVSGTFYDSGGPTGNYGVYENCTLLIQPECALEIALSFSAFYSPSGYDVMTIYDGSDANGTLLKYYGPMYTAPSDTIIATSGSIFIAFSTNGSLNYSGFEGSWSAIVETPPTANFSTPTLTPPLNTPIPFSNLTNNPFCYYSWDFGDGFTSTDENPTHTYTTPGMYEVSLISYNCAGTDTLNQFLNVQLAPGFSSNLSVIYDTLSCNDSVSIPITLYNNGQGDLVVTTDNIESTIGNDSYFRDGFENGWQSNWVNEYVITPNQHIVTTDDYPKSGDSCLVLYGNAANSIKYEFTPDTVNYFSVSIRKNVNTGNTSFAYLGDANSYDGIVGIYSSGVNDYAVYGQSTFYYVVSTPNVWTTFDIKNINYDTKTFDIYINDTLSYSQMGFKLSSVSAASKITLRNNNSFYPAFYDNIKLGHSPVSSWTGTQPDSVVVGANDSLEINGVISSENLISGHYTSNLILNSNDNNNLSDTIQVDLTVLGSPNIEIAESCISFDTIMQNLTQTKKLHVLNSGCDTLSITNVSAVNPNFIVLGQTTFLIPPNDSISVPIQFAPSTNGSFSGNILIENNDVDTLVCIEGFASPAPIITVNPDTIFFSTTNCIDSIMVPITISNTGAINLNGNISLQHDNSPNQGFLFEGFEEGNYGNWYVSTGNSVQVTSVDPASGQYCLSLLGSGLTGMIYSFDESTYDYVSVKMKSSEVNTVNNYFKVGSYANTSGILTISYEGNNIYKINTQYYTTYYEVQNEWTHFEFKNIDFATHTLDVYIDGSLYASNISFSLSVNSMGNVSLVNQNIIFPGYYDDIQIGTNSNESNLTVSSDSFNISSNDSTIVNVNIKTDNWVTGNYSSNIIINSNDPLHPQDTVTVLVDLDGSPKIELPNSCLDFGSIMQYHQSTDSVVIHNTGCDTLFIGDLSMTLPEFSLSQDSTYVLPGDSLNLIVTFSPVTSGNFDDTIFITNSDIDTTICVFASAYGMPIIALNPTEISASLACNDSITVPITIYNNGLSTLNGNINSESLTAQYETPNYFFEGFEDGDFDGWLTTSGLVANIETTGSASGTNNLAISGSSNSYIHKFFTPDSIKYISFKIKLSPFDLNNYGAIATIHTSYNQMMYLNYSAGNQGDLMLNGGHFLNHDLSTDWLKFDLRDINYNDKNYDVYINDTLVLSNIPFAFSSSNYTSNFVDEIRLYAYNLPHQTHYDDIQFGMSVVPNYYEITDTFSVLSLDSTIVNLTLFSDSLSDGVYAANIYFESNDPLNPIDTIPLELTVSGQPLITFSDSCVNFDSTMVNAFNVNSITIFNDGCNDLIVDSLEFNNPAFSTNQSSFILAPHDSIEIPLNFAPTILGNHSALLTVYSNLGDTTVCLNGYGTEAPHIQVYPDSIFFQVDLCDASFQIDTNVVLTNSGLADLEYSVVVANSILDNFENGSYNVSQLWDNVSGGIVDDGCGEGVGSKALRFNGYNIRSAYTYAFNTLDGAQVRFWLKYGNNSTTPCESPDSGENVVLEYMKNSTWYILNTYDLSDFQNLTYIEETLPESAQSSSTRFRWRQLDHDETYADNWIIDDVEVVFGVDDVLQTISVLAPNDSILIPFSLSLSNTQPGIYNFPLVIPTNDPLDSFKVVNVLIEVLNNPCAEFNYYYHNNVCSGFVSFIDFSDNNPTSWHWDFGDGSTSTEESPSHSFLATGNYLVELIVCNEVSCDTNLQVVNIQGVEGSVVINCSPTTIVDDTIIGIYEVELNNSINQSNAAINGYQDFSCDLFAIIEQGLDYELKIKYESSAPTKQFDIWLDLNNNGVFDFGEMLNQSYSVTDSVSITLNVPSNVEYGIPLRLRIVYDNQLNVSNNPCQNIYNGEIEDYSIIVQPNTSAPSANFGYVIVDGCNGEVSFSDSTLFNPFAWTWDFGDGNMAYSQNPTHFYQQPGNYFVTLVTQNAYGYDTILRNITVNPLINCDIQTIGVLANNTPIQFTTNCSSASSFVWSFGDGSQSFIQSPIHLYSNSGEYIVNLYAENDYGCNYYISDTIFIGTIGIKEQAKFDINIYPNPNDGQFKIDIPETLNISEIYVKSALGEIISIVKIDENGDVNLSYLSSGIYFIEIVSGSNNILKKLIINK